jgi:hypothetical protein
MNKKLLELIRKHFERRLSAKTGWGRVELLAEYDKAVADAAMELLDGGL